MVCIKFFNFFVFTNTHIQRHTSCNNNVKLVYTHINIFSFKRSRFHKKIQSARKNTKFKTTNTHTQRIKMLSIGDDNLSLQSHSILFTRLFYSVTFPFFPIFLYRTLFIESIHFRKIHSHSSLSF